MNKIGAPSVCRQDARRQTPEPPRPKPMTGTSDRFGSTAVDPQLARERRRPAASGLMHRSKKALFDYFVGASEQQGRQLQAELPVQFFGSRQTQIPLYSGFLAPTFAKHAFSQDAGSTGQLPSHRIS